ncbi:MAG: hypothetical protein QOJ00_3016 [Actinomycetota bacterium]
MKRSLLRDLVCPYCGGTFTVTAEAVADDDRVEWGLVECRCFEFPIVDGVLLLSLAKDHAGPEDRLNPYAPLLIAAIEYLRNRDVDGLRAWIGRHVPEVAGLLRGSDVGTYLSVSARLGVDIAPLVKQHLDEMSKYEVIGVPRTRDGLRSKLGRGSRPSAAVVPDRNVELSRLVDYYTTRFFSPRANALAMRMGHLDMTGRIVSLCCGHGVFENFVRALGMTAELVCIDAQLVNLLITRTFANADASFVLHDVQFPLPFASGSVDGVFSSTCLPELPSQKAFIDESIRITAPTGWTFFDRTWNVEIGARRIEPTRHYRFAQNFFGRLEQYVELFRECAGPDRDVGVDMPRPTAAYVDDPGWSFGPDADARLAARTKLELSALVVNPSTFKGFVAPNRSAAMTPKRLSVSPVFDVDARSDRETLQLTRRPQLAHLDAELGETFTPFPESQSLPRHRFGDRGFLLEHFCQGTLALLPDRFDTASTTLDALLG